MEAYLESVEQQATDLLTRAQMIILAEIERQKLTTKALSHITGLSEDSIKSFRSGKTLKNTGYITVTAIAKALNIDLNHLADYQPIAEPETPALPVIEASITQIEDILKACEKQINLILSVCDARVADAERNCEARIADLKEAHAEYIKILLSAK